MLWLSTKESSIEESGVYRGRPKAREATSLGDMFPDDWKTDNIKDILLKSHNLVSWKRDKILAEKMYSAFAPKKGIYELQ